MIFLRFTLVFVLGVMLLACRAGSGYIYMADTTHLFYVNNNEIFSPNNLKQLYFVKGNIFFNAGADDKQNIYLMSTSLNFADTRQQVVYEKDSRRAAYSFVNSRFYYGKPEKADLEDNELLYIERKGKWLCFYSTFTDSLLAYYLADSLPPAIGVFTAYTVIDKFKLVQKLNTRPKPAPMENAGFSTIKPVWGNTTQNEWIWDGQVLKPRWNADARFAWTYDGETVKPLYGNNIYAQYSWDGENFKPIWRTSRAEEWTWDGKTFKPAWNADFNNQYNVDGRIVRPWNNVTPEKEWTIDGDIPMPLIILIVSGIARAF